MLKSFRRSFIVASLVAVTVLQAGCGGGVGSGNEALDAGDLVVQVVDARNPATTLAGATVTVQAGSKTRSVTTAADGTVTIRDLPAGSATVTVTRDQFREFTSTGVVDSTRPVRLTAQLQRRTGQVDVEAVDAFATPVANVQVQISVEGQIITGVTGATGRASLVGVPTGTVAVQANASGFQAEPDQSVVVVENPPASLAFALDRKTEVGGGTLPPQSGEPSLPPADGGQTLTFRVRTVVIDGQGHAIEDRQAADFSLVACVDSRSGVADCVRSPTDATFDAAYTPTSPTPSAFQKVPGQAPVPFAVALGYDQSGSISTTDPSDARVFASKGFLQTVESTDRVVVTAFASGAAAKLPTLPVTTWGSFSSSGAGFFDELDLLPTLEGGETPLFSSLDAMLQYTAQNAPTGVPGLRKAVALFSDGFDNVCADAAVCRENSIALSRTLGVDVFTIGLANSVDSATLAELAHRANGVHLVAANAEQLNALYGALGSLLRGSISTYETTWTIQAANAGVFASGRSVLGVVKVVTADKTLELPFLYRIP